VVTVVDLLNVNVLHSGNLELICLGGFVAFVVWVLVGAFFVYHAQNKMKLWFTYEAIAHNEEELEKLRKKQIAIYEKYQATGQVNMAKLDKIRD